MLAAAKLEDGGDGPNRSGTEGEIYQATLPRSQSDPTAAIGDENERLRRLDEIDTNPYARRQPSDPDDRVQPPGSISKDDHHEA